MPQIKIGTFVKSAYRSRWTGVVIDYSYYRNGKYPAYDILIVKDSGGQTPRKRIINRLGEGWLTIEKPFDISHINKEWLIPLNP